MYVHACEHTHSQDFIHVLDMHSHEHISTQLTNIHKHVFACIHVYMRAYMYIGVHVCMHGCIRAYVVLAHACVYVWTCMHPLKCY